MGRDKEEDQYQEKKFLYVPNIRNLRIERLPDPSVHLFLRCRRLIQGN